MKKIYLILMIALIIPGMIVSAQNPDTPKRDSLKILSDKNAELYIRLAQISLNNKDYNSTIAYADSALARDKSFLAYQLKGLGQFNLGMFKETILTMSLGIEIKESDFILHFYRGLSYHKSDSILYAEQISKDMLWSVTINPLDTMSYYYKGMAAFNLSFMPNCKKDEKLKECIGDLGQYTKLTPNFTAYYTKGLANFLLGGSSDITPENRAQYYNETILSMTECLKLQPNNEDCLYYRSLSYLVSGEFEKAIDDIEILKKKSSKKAGWFKK